MKEGNEKFDAAQNGEYISGASFVTEGAIENNNFPAYQMPEKITVDGKEFSAEEVFSASPFSSPEFAALKVEDQKEIIEIVEDAAVLRDAAEGGVIAAQSAALANEFFAADTTEKPNGKTEEVESLVSRTIAWIGKFGRQLTVAGLVGVAMLAPMKSANAQNYGGEVAVAAAEANAQRAQVKVRAAQVRENFKKIQHPTETQIAQYEADMARVNADIARIDNQERGTQGQAVYGAQQRDAQRLYAETQQRVQYTEVVGQIERLKVEKVQNLLYIDAQIKQLQMTRLQVMNQGGQQIQQIMRGGWQGRGWNASGVVLQGGQNLAQIDAQINNLQLEKAKIAVVFDTRISSLEAQLPQQTQYPR